MDVELLQQHLPEIAVAVSLVTAAIRYTPTAWRVFKQMYALLKVLEAIALIPEKVDELTKEVKPNGGSSLRDVVDRVAGSLATLRDSVDMLALRQSTKWKLTSGLPGWESDERGRCISANLELCTLVGRPEEDIKGSNWKNMIHYDDMPHVFSEWARIVSDSSDFDVDARYIKPDGTVLPVRIRARAMNVNGKAVGWIGVVEVIERHK